MREKVIVLIVLMLSCLIFLQSDETIIIDNGNWSGEIKADESGFLVFVEGVWEQTGVNVGTESILSFLDDYSPKITAVGSNKVKATYKEVGWVFASGGPTVSGEVSFNTAKEVISATASPIERKEVFRKRIGGFINETKGDFPYTAEFTGSTTESWEESNTLSNTIEVSAEKNISGKLSIDSLIELGSESTIGVKNAVTVTRTTTKSGSNTSSLTQTIGPFVLKPTERVDIYLVSEADTEKIDVKHLLDADKNGISEGEGSHSFIAQAECNSILKAIQ